MTLVEQELLIVPGHANSQPFIVGFMEETEVFSVKCYKLGEDRIIQRFRLFQG